MKTKLCWKCDSFVFFWLTEVQTEVFYSRIDTAHTPFHKVRNCISTHGCRHPTCNRRTEVADPSFSLRLDSQEQ